MARIRYMKMNMSEGIPVRKIAWAKHVWTFLKMLTIENPTTEIHKSQGPGVNKFCVVFWKHTYLSDVVGWMGGGDHHLYGVMAESTVHRSRDRLP